MSGMAEGRSQQALFDRAVIALARLLIRLAIIVQTRQFNACEHGSQNYFLATVSLYAIKLLAGVLGVVVHAWHGVVAGAETKRAGLAIHVDRLEVGSAVTPTRQAIQ